MMISFTQRIIPLAFIILVAVGFAAVIFTGNHESRMVVVKTRSSVPSLDIFNDLLLRITYPIITKTFPPLSIACFSEDAIICKALQSTGRWEVFDPQEYFLANLFTFQKQRYFMDFGSNIGLFALMLASKGNWKGIAVEPLFSSVVQFNVLANKQEERIRIEKVALSADGIGAIKMVYGGSNPGGSNALPDSDSRARNVQVPKTTIDMIVEKYEQEGFIPKGVEFDYVKMDIEGFEMKALHGATKLLAQRRVKLWQIELSVNINRAGDDPKELVRLLTSHGYTMYWGSDKTRPITPETLEISGWHDAFAFRNDLLSLQHF
ncbi:hypothetical protein C9374_000698 [Naegleria lovaniensis]|uniref:Methyltransferase FkbM domain-containing protein n=1 Tax=Naegleria lovaniensis TaxID=51637 RepID=A0AA88GZI3_NAELO|nr:uncharacterized protein C9374_000698 [Naegleria lovaniensis]KAG2388534.1 hypothetical protein C9374_000698 [Naegleria lovaniensis]